METPQTNDSEDNVSAEAKVSPYFQRPQSAIPMAKRKGRPEDADEIQPTQQGDPSKKKCFVCAERRRKCVGIYPFIEKCGHCKRYRRRCYPEDEGKRKPQPAEEKCFRCRQSQLLCDGTYPFTRACGQCKAHRRRCTAKSLGKALSRDQKCQRCAVSSAKCFGEPPFKNRCGRCKDSQYNCYPQGTEIKKHEIILWKPRLGLNPSQARTTRQTSRRTRTAEPPEKGLPEDQKCQRCTKNRTKCIGEPPFVNKCGYCKTKKLRCYTQGIEAPKPIPIQDVCVGCAFDSSWRRRCDGKTPCTRCVTRNHACNYKEGDVKWTYQPNPEKWKQPTFPTCNECLQWNQSHFGKTLHCDGKSPCNCCLEELGTTQSSNCSYRYENGATKFIRLHGERAQTLRETQSRHGKQRTKQRQKLRRGMGIRASQNNTTAEDENVLDEDLINNTGDKEDSQIEMGRDSSQGESGSIAADERNSSDHDGTDSDAGGQSDKEQSSQDHDHDYDHDLRSGFFNHENSKSRNDTNQKRVAGRDPSPPDDQNEWGGFESSVLEEDPPNESRLRDPQGYGDGISHRLVDARGLKKRKISRIRSTGGSRESFGRRRL